jgi:uncharacterized repeat protein (TIGR01451 family)
MRLTTIGQMVHISKFAVAAIAMFAAIFSNEVFAHGVGFQNTRIFMDPATVANLNNRPVPGIASNDLVSFILAVDTAQVSGPVGYYTMYIPNGATVIKAEFVDSTYNSLSASAPTAMEDGWGLRGGPLTFTNWTATSGNGSIAVLNGDTGVFYSTNPITQLFNPNADGTIATSVAGATIRTTSQLMGYTATHNMWDANQTRAFGAGTVNAAANTPSTAPVINTAGLGTTPFNSGSAVAGPDVGYKLDNTGAVGPWNRISYPNSYSTKGVPSAAAPVTSQGVLAVVGVPTTAGVSFPLPNNTNAVRWVIGSPRAPGSTYYVRITLQFNATLLAKVNGFNLDAEASGADADGSNAGKDNVWRYYQPAATDTTVNNSALSLVLDIIAVNGVASLNPATIPAGATITYRMRYLNSSALRQTGIVLSNKVPAQTSLVCPSITAMTGATAVSNTCPVVNGTVTFAIPSSLNAGQGGAVTFDLKTASNANSVVTSTGKIVSTQNTTGASASNTTALQMPDVTIAKSHAGSFGQGQQGALYTITASNVGNFNTSGLITVTDTLPSGITATVASGTGWACTITAPANLITTCTRSDALAAGAGYPPINLTVNVTSNAATPRVNSVTIAGGGEANIANNTATDSTIISTKPDLIITKTHTGNFFQGQTNAAYTLTVSNIGGLRALTNTVTVVDTLPAGLTYVSSAGGANFTCTAVGQIVTCKNGANINSNTSAAAITLNVSIAANASTPLVNLATVSGGGELNTTNNNATDSTVILKPPVVNKAFSPTTIVANSPSTLTITLTNKNAVPMILSATAANGAAVFTDVFPVPMRVAATPAITNTCGGALVDSGNGVLAANDVGIRLNYTTASPTTIPANSSCKVTVNVTSTATGTNNTGTVATVGSGTGVSSSAVLTVIAPVAPTIVKNFSPNPIANAVSTTLTITVTNPNAVPINAVTFTDTYPATSFSNTTTAAFTAASTAAGCTGIVTGLIAGTSLGLTAGVVPANASCDISVKVVASATGNFTNTITSVSTTNNGITATTGTIASPAATKILNVLAVVPPFIAKAFSPASVGTNEVSTLTFTITNPNNATVGTIAGVAFSDTYPSGLVNAPTPNATTTCNSGSITSVTAGGNSIALTGASIATGTSCTVSVNVRSATANAYVNTSGAVSSTTTTPFVVGTGNTAIATLTVLAKPTINKSFAVPYILPGDTTTLTLTLNNPTALALSNVAFTDNFPINLLVATPNALNNGCGGTATAASGVVSLTGGSLIAGGSCTITLDVSSNVPGNYNNTSGGISSAETGSAGAVSNTVSLSVVTKPSISKSFSPASIVAGGTSILTLQISNPNAIALTDLGFTDNFPTDIMVASTPAITNNCGGTFAHVANDVSINLANGSVAANGTCTVTVKVTGLIAGSFANTADGVSSLETGVPGSPSNTVVLDITLPGVPVSGFVYADANHNIQKEGAETGTGLALYAKIIPIGGGPAIDAVPVNASTGAYQFAAIPVGEYIIIIDDNATLGDTTPVVPAVWLSTEMAGLMRNNVQVSNTELQNLNFGLFNGSILSGTVFADTGIGGGTASNGIKDGGELGIANVTVNASTGDNSITDGAGSYTLWIPASATGAISIAETNQNDYLSTGGSAGNTGGSYNLGADATSFSFVLGSTYTGVNFGDVPNIRFAADGQQSGLVGNVVFYPHQFDSGSGGSVEFSSLSAAGWPNIIYRDLNCNSQIDAGDPVLSAAITVAAGERVCIINKATIPTGTGTGLKDITTVEAIFTSLSIFTELSVFDTTTVGAVSAGLVLTKAVDKTTAMGGDTLTYTLNYQNNSNAPIASIVINDATPAYTTFVSAICVSSPPPAVISACTVSSPVAGAVGTVKWTLTGTLSPSAAGQVKYSVKVDN